MKIVDLDADDQPMRDQCAEIMYEGFKDMWPYMCPDLEKTTIQVERMLGPERIARVAVSEDGRVLGWIGAVPEYDGHAWCIHPLAVRADRRRQGIGRALVTDLEAQVRRRGATTIFLGTDDTLGMTSLGGRDLYPDPLQHAANIQNLANHPYEFYQKLGYAIVGVIPDANGLGKPDIYMAKRLTVGSADGT